MSDMQGGQSDDVGTAPDLPEEIRRENYLRVIDQVVSGGALGEAQRTSMSESSGVWDEDEERWTAEELQKIPELHVCMGLNACKGHDRPGDAQMAGMGQCATVLHVCHGANACRGQGGCGYTGPDAELARPGEQACRWNGSCASPINESRVFAGGPAKGKSVWKLARELFEARMYAAGVAFGPSPGEGYPDAMVPIYESKKPKIPASPASPPGRTPE
ncbi:MAG: hypothetical protein ACT4NP_06350 [Pseudonocardiales bacterium]